MNRSTPLRGTDMNIELLGTDWCGGCKAVRKKLMSINMPFTFTELPPGPRGWEILEELTGRRAVPAVLVDGSPMPLMEFKDLINGLNRPERELTEDELDELL